MTGPTAQLVALACHFNGRIRGFRHEQFFPTNSTSQFCEYIQFVRDSNAGLNADEWLACEARSGRKAIVTHSSVNDARISDRASAGFVGGGGHWRLSIIAENRMDVWESRWVVGNRQAQDRRIWQVRYALAGGDQNAVIADANSLDAIIRTFTQTLEGILAFCRDHQLDNFAVTFRTAAECLIAARPFQMVYHKDLAPLGLLNVEAERVLAACQAASVFGGMGYWNDLGFDGLEQARYETLSAGLFQLLNTAICAATNSTAPNWG